MEESVAAVSGSGGVMELSQNSGCPVCLSGEKLANQSRSCSRQITVYYSIPRSVTQSVLLRHVFTRTSIGRIRASTVALSALSPKSLSQSIPTELVDNQLMTRDRQRTTVFRNWICPFII